MPLSLHSSLISIARKASGLLFLVCNTLVFIIIITIAGCKSDSTIHKSDISIIPYHKYAGRTMGTTYNITYDSLFVNIPQRKIDSILVAINQSVSTYIDTSTISKINKKTAEDAKEIEILVNGLLGFWLHN